MASIHLQSYDLDVKSMFLLLASGWIVTKRPWQGFPGGAVVKNPPANAGGTGSSPGLGRSHMLWSN